MIIPNDDGVNYRTEKFIEYQRAVPPVHQKILSDYVIQNHITQNDMVLIAWLMSNTYNEVTALLMYEQIKYDRLYLLKFRQWWDKNKQSVLFGSAKKYNKIQDRFLTTIDFFYNTYGEKPYDYLTNIVRAKIDPCVKYCLIKSVNKRCLNFGRFSEDLFLEVLVLFDENNKLKLNIKNDFQINWVESANLTSAIFNLMYLDDMADKYDKGLVTRDELRFWEPKLNNKLKEITDKIETKYGKKIEVSLFITKLCSFRNLFKGKRYAGYHHDRQLEYINKYKHNWVQPLTLWDRLLDARRRVFPKNLLGELNNWGGIRKERTKLWLTYGLTGAEDVV